jgi:hypothetical protein
MSTVSPLGAVCVASARRMSSANSETAITREFLGISVKAAAQYRGALRLLAYTPKETLWTLLISSWSSLTTFETVQNASSGVARVRAIYRTTIIALRVVRRKSDLPSLPQSG